MVEKDNVVRLNFSKNDDFEHIMGPQKGLQIGNLMRSGSDQLRGSLRFLMQQESLPIASRSDGITASEAAKLSNKFSSLNMINNNYDNKIGVEDKKKITHSLSMVNLLLARLLAGSGESKSIIVDRISKQHVKIDDLRGRLLFFQTEANRERVLTSIGSVGVMACYWSEYPEGLCFVSNSSLATLETFDPEMLAMRRHICQSEAVHESNALINVISTADHPYGLELTIPFQRKLRPKAERLVRAQLWTYNPDG